MDQKDLIEEIRKDEYLVGVDLGQHNRGADSLRRKLDGALKLLSTDLYSKETHFVLELIQNADDNGYGEEITPSIAFDVSREVIRVNNNEIGFFEPNVKAICSLNESTKANKEGFIGEKGIGFKSVFTVSEKPEIHSNGFHFFFDISGNDRLGYVLPNWIDNPPESTKGLGTTIILPAKKGKEFSDVTVEQLKPELLLFLRKLKSINIKTSWNDSVREITREDLDQNRLVLREVNRATDTKKVQIEQKYYSVSCPVDMTPIKEEKRPDFISTEIILAFPLREDESPEINIQNNAFAFLPIDDFGLKFVLQADFLLSSNRENIHFDNHWNLRIRDEIPTAFLRAVEHFKKHPILKTSYYSYLSIRRTNEFFSKAISKTIELLSESECVLTQSGSWRKPSDVLMGSKTDHQLISNEDLVTVLGKEYASDQIQTSHDVLSKIGLKDFSLNHLLACLDNQSWLDEKPLSWINELLVYLSKRPLSDAIIERLRKRKILPLTNGDLASTHEGEIFLPLRKGEKYGFEDELRTLNSEVLPTKEPDRDMVLKLLQKLNVRQADVSQVIEKYILPLHSSDSIPNDVDILIGHIRYIKDNLDEYLRLKFPIQQGSEVLGKALQSDILRELSELWVYTTINENVWEFDRLENCYLGNRYGNKYGLESLFIAGSPVSFISPIYLKDDNKNELEKWSAFFMKLGAGIVPRVNKDEGIRASFPNVKNKFCRQFIVKDCVPSDELKQVLECEDKKRKSRLLQLIDQNWDSYYASFSRAIVTPHVRNGMAENVPSTFFRHLQSMKVLTKDKKWTELKKCFVENEEIVTSFGNKLPFLNEVKLSERFLDDLEITHKVTLSAAISWLKEISSIKGTASKQNLVTLIQVIDIQSKNDAQKTSQVINEFSSNSLIHVPKHPKKWLTLSEVCWDGINSLVEQIVPSLKGRYGDVESFFKKTLKVKDSPDPEQLIMVLEKLPELEEENEAKDNAAELIYRALGKDLRKNKEDTEAEWLHEFGDNFWTNKHELWMNDDDIFINDDPEVGDLFNDNPNVAFLKVRRDDISQLDVFIEKTGLKYLSSSIHSEIPSDIKKDYLAEFTELFQSRFGYILRYLYTHHNHWPNALFDRLLKSGKLQELSRANIYSVNDLRIEINLNNEKATVKRECCLVEDCIYIENELVDDEEIAYVVLAAELARAFEAPGCQSFINQILESSGEKKLERITKDLRYLPKEEEERFRLKTPVPQDVVESEEFDDEVLPEPVVEDETTIFSDTAIDVTTPEAEEGVTRLNPISLSKGKNSPYESSIEDGSRVKEKPVHVDHQTVTSANPSQSTNGSSKSKRPFDRQSPRSTLSKIEGTITLDKIRNKKQGRGYSYVFTEKDREEREKQDKDRSAVRMEISKAAVDKVKEAEESAGFELLFVAEDETHNNPGFDMYSKKGNESRYIEIKGTDGPWAEYGVSVSPTQLDFSRKNIDNSWLYVVEYARSTNSKLYKIPRFYEKITDFMFDGGWKEFAVKDNASEKREISEPEKGMTVYIKRLNQKGVIESVTKPGNTICKIKVVLDGGKKVDLLFEPANMTLEKS